MRFFDDIIELLHNIADFFWGLYYETYDKAWPINLLADPFYGLYYAFVVLAWNFGDFKEWAADTSIRVLSILSWSSIRGLILGWIPNLETIGTWFSQVTANVTAIITTWWETVTDTVQGWIDVAVDALGEMVNGISAALTTLQGEWEGFKLKLPAFFAMLFWFTNWWAEILSPLTDWWAERLKEVDTLISDTIKAWFPFYDDLVSLWDSIVEFFVNPLDWLLDNFNDWFLGPEE